MSDMNGNPHIKDAIRYINEASSLHDWPITERGIIAANAQALATLALAYEARTANLIALMGMSPVDLSDWPQPAITNFLGQNNNIMTRLGLNEGATK